MASITLWATEVRNCSGCTFSIANREGLPCGFENCWFENEEEEEDEIEEEI